MWYAGRMTSLQDILAAEARPEVAEFRAMSLDAFDAVGPKVLASGDKQLEFIWKQESRRRLLNKTALGLPEQTPPA